MAKAKVKLKFNGSIKALKNNIVTRALQQNLGLSVIAEMKEAMSIGLSPVKGVGRFDGYAVQRKTVDNKNSLYPLSVQGKYPGKNIRPVNLKLTGDLQDNLDWQGVKQGVELGHLDMSQDIENKFEAHNEGMAKGVPRRKYLPNKKGETFIVTIMQRIKEIYSERIKFIIRNNR